MCWAAARGHAHSAPCMVAADFDLGRVQQPGGDVGSIPLLADPSVTDATAPPGTDAAATTHDAAAAAGGVDPSQQV